MCINLQIEPKKLSEFTKAIALRLGQSLNQNTIHWISNKKRAKRCKPQNYQN